MQCERCEAEAEPGRKLCLVHLIERRKWSADHRARRKAEGKCSVCGGEPLVTTRYCKICHVLYQKRPKATPCAVCHTTDHVQTDHRRLKICWYCPKKILRGSNLCPDHHKERQERDRIAARELRERWRREGRCIICGKEAVNQSRCEKHRQYAANWEKERRIRPV